MGLIILKNKSQRCLGSQNLSSFFREYRDLDRLCDQNLWTKIFQGSRRYGGQNIKTPALQHRKILVIGYPTNKDFDLKIKQRQVILLLFSGTLKGFGLTN